MVQKSCAEGKIHNPETNRCVNDTPANRSKIAKIKKNSIINNVQVKLSSRASVKLSPKISSKLSPRSLKLSLHSTHLNQLNIPSMGPLIHPEYIYNFEDEKNDNKRYQIFHENYYSIYRYIYLDRFTNIGKSKTNIILSEMEMDDLLKLGKKVREYLNRKNMFTIEQYDSLKKIEKKIKHIMKKETTTLIHDLPEKKYIGTNEIYSSRYDIRELVLGIYNRIRRDIYGLNNVLKTKKFGREIINNTHIQSVYRDKEYIDEIIRLGIFSYDDLWNNVFKDPQIYEKLLKTYAEYLELYNKLEKEKQSGGKKRKQKK